MNFDILSTKENEFTVTIAGNRATATKKKSIERKGARVFKNNGIALSSYVGNIKDEDLLEKCSAKEQGLIAFDYDIPERKNCTEDVIQKRISTAEFAALAEESLQKMKNRFPKFIFSGKAYFNDFEKNMRDSVGTIQNLKAQYQSIGFEYKHQDSTSIIDGWCSASSLKELRPLADMELSLKFLDNYEKESQIKPGKMPVVFSAAQLLKKLAESLRIDKYRDGSALLAGKLGKQVFSKDFSLEDVCFDPDHNIIAPFDREGFVRENPRLGIFANGVFKNVICDLKNAKKFNTKSTGNGTGSYQSNATLGFNQLMVTPGKRNLDAILADQNEAIFIEMAAGGDFTDDGSFATPVMLSYLMRNGEIVGRLPQLTVKSSMWDMFGSALIEVASHGNTATAANPYLAIEMDVMVN